MSFDLDDTIAAIATAPGGAIRGIVRISGPDCLTVVESLVGWDKQAELASAHRALPTSRRGMIRLPRDLGKVPVTVYLWPSDRSYTRQPSAELHLPGSPPLLEAALEALCNAGARLAQPGEFTMRAFLAGRLDLTQAEAVLGVIDASSARELDAALAQLAGGLARPLAALRQQLLDLLVHLEAGLDFVDEDIEFISAATLENQLAEASTAVANIAQQMKSRGEAGRIPRIVLMGLPNVGKSSLLNALAGDDAAIVSEIAGTTRDFVTRRVKIGGRECLITDTAGLTATRPTMQIDAAAQDATQVQVEQADLTLLCIDSSRPMESWERDAIRSKTDGKCFVVWTKCDVGQETISQSELEALATSSRSGEGLENLRRLIERELDDAEGDGRAVAGTVSRCRESLRLAAEALQRAHGAASSMQGEEFVAAEVRVALEELGRVVGAVYTEDILDRVFNRFCIGK